MNIEQPEKPDFCFRKRRRGHKCRRVQSAMRIRDVGVLGGSFWWNSQRSGVCSASFLPRSSAHVFACHNEVELSSLGTDGPAALLKNLIS